MALAAADFAAIPGLVRKRSDHFRIADRTPGHAFAPAGIEALSQALRLCDDAGLGVVIFGGGTLQSIGAPPARYDVALVLEQFRSLLSYEPRDLTVAVEAGARVADLARTLAEHHQFLPLDPPRPRDASVGGTLAAGWAGPRRHVHGRLRDFVIGSTVVLADGTVAKAGGMVVKNVTGYDMSKLYVGSLGTLAAIVQANFKTLPLAASARVAIAPLPEGTRHRIVHALQTVTIEPTVAALIAGFAREVDGSDGVEGRLFLRFEGTPATIERATRDVRSALGAAGVPDTAILDSGADHAFERLLDAYIAPLSNRSVTYRNLGAPASAMERAAQIAALAQQDRLNCETIVDLCNGDLIARVSAKNRAECELRIVLFDEHLHDQLERANAIAGDDRLRGSLDPWGRTPAALEKMRAIKTRFDPHGTLARGRFVGGL